jgi:hypothetical protein
MTVIPPFKVAFHHRENQGKRRNDIQQKWDDLLFIFVVLAFASFCGFNRKWIKENGDLKKERCNGVSKIRAPAFSKNLFSLVSRESRKLEFKKRFAFILERVLGN